MLHRPASGFDGGLRLRSVLLSAAAERHLEELLVTSEDRFGPAARGRYEALFVQAVQDLVENSERVGVHPVSGRLHYHLRHSRDRVAGKLGRVGSPRHILVARVVGEELWILAVAHDAMVDELAVRIEGGENR